MVGQSFTFDDSPEKYDNLGILGEGSYGSVYKVKTKNSGVMALKALPIEEDQTKEEIMKEINIMKRCAGSDFVVDYYKHMQKKDTIYILMELCDAGSVSDIMQICDLHFTETEIQDIMVSCLLGLNHMHSQGILHRDIKAGNLLLTHQGEIKLSDFGVSAILRTKSSKRTTVIGTPFWMSPEIIMEQPYGYKADVWAAGVTMIEIAEGEPPYSDEPPLSVMLKIPSRPPPKLKSSSKWSKHMVALLTLSLQKDVKKRPLVPELLEMRFCTERNCLERLQKDGRSQQLKMIVAKNIKEVEAYRRMEQRTRQGVAENADSDSDSDDPFYHQYGNDESYVSNTVLEDPNPGRKKSSQSKPRRENKESENFSTDFDFERFVQKTIVGVRELTTLRQGFDESRGMDRRSRNVIEMSGERERLLEKCEEELMKAEEEYKQRIERVKLDYERKRLNAIREACFAEVAV